MSSSVSSTVQLRQLSDRLVAQAGEAHSLLSELSKELSDVFPQLQRLHVAQRNADAQCVAIAPLLSLSSNSASLVPADRRLLTQTLPSFERAVAQLVATLRKDPHLALCIRSPSRAPSPTAASPLLPHPGPEALDGAPSFVPTAAPATAYPVSFVHTQASANPNTAAIGGSLAEVRDDGSAAPKRPHVFKLLPRGLSPQAPVAHIAAAVDAAAVAICDAVTDASHIDGDPAGAVIAAAGGRAAGDAAAGGAAAAALAAATGATATPKPTLTMSGVSSALARLDDVAVTLFASIDVLIVPPLAIIGDAAGGLGAAPLMGGAGPDVHRAAASGAGGASALRRRSSIVNPPDTPAAAGSISGRGGAGSAYRGADGDAGDEDDEEDGGDGDRDGNGDDAGAAAAAASERGGVAASSRRGRASGGGACGAYSPHSSHPFGAAAHAAAVVATETLASHIQEFVPDAHIAIGPLQAIVAALAAPSNLVLLSPAFLGYSHNTADAWGAGGAGAARLAVGGVSAGVAAGVAARQRAADAAAGAGGTRNQRVLQAEAAVDSVAVQLRVPMLRVALQPAVDALAATHTYAEVSHSPLDPSHTPVSVVLQYLWRDAIPAVAAAEKAVFTAAVAAAVEAFGSDVGSSLARFRGRLQDDTSHDHRSAGAASALRRGAPGGGSAAAGAAGGATDDADGAAACEHPGGGGGGGVTWTTSFDHPAAQATFDPQAATALSALGSPVGAAPLLPLPRRNPRGTSARVVSAGGGLAAARGASAWADAAAEASINCALAAPARGAVALTLALCGAAAWTAAGAAGDLPARLVVPSAGAAGGGAGGAGVHIHAAGGGHVGALLGGGAFGSGPVSAAAARSARGVGPRSSRRPSFGGAGGAFGARRVAGDALDNAMPLTALPAHIWLPDVAGASTAAAPVVVEWSLAAAAAAVDAAPHVSPIARWVLLSDLVTGPLPAALTVLRAVAEVPSCAIAASVGALLRAHVQALLRPQPHQVAASEALWKAATSSVFVSEKAKAKRRRDSVKGAGAGGAAGDGLFADDDLDGGTGGETAQVAATSLANKPKASIRTAVLSDGRALLSLVVDAASASSKLAHLQIAALVAPPPPAAATAAAAAGAFAAAMAAVPPSECVVMSPAAHAALPPGDTVVIRRANARPGTCGTDAEDDPAASGAPGSAAATAAAAAGTDGASAAGLGDLHTLPAAHLGSPICPTGPFKATVTKIPNTLVPPRRVQAQLSARSLPRSGGVPPAVRLLCGIALASAHDIARWVPDVVCGGDGASMLSTHRAAAAAAASATAAAATPAGGARRRSVVGDTMGMGGAATSVQRVCSLLIGVAIEVAGVAAVALPQATAAVCVANSAAHILSTLGGKAGGGNGPPVGANGKPLDATVGGLGGTEVQGSTLRGTADAARGGVGAVRVNPAWYESKLLSVEAAERLLGRRAAAIAGYAGVWKAVVNTFADLSESIRRENRAEGGVGGGGSVSIARGSSTSKAVKSALTHFEREMDAALRDHCGLSGRADVVVDLRAAAVAAVVPQYTVFYSLVMSSGFSHDAHNHARVTPRAAERALRTIPFSGSAPDRWY